MFILNSMYTYIYFLILLLIWLTRNELYERAFWENDAPCQISSRARNSRFFRDFCSDQQLSFFPLAG